MKYTQKDFEETALVAGLVKKIDNIDAEYVNTVSDEIFKQQPFFMSSLLGHSIDVTPLELEELMKIYFLIWEYFKAKNKIPSKKITEKHFEKMLKKNLQMLKYSEGEPMLKDKMNVYSSDLQNIQSKSLITAIYYKYQNQPVLVKMKTNVKAGLLIGMKSLIECFETIEP